MTCRAGPMETRTVCDPTVVARAADSGSTVTVRSALRPLRLAIEPETSTSTVAAVPAAGRSVARTNTSLATGGLSTASCATVTVTDPDAVNPLALTTVYRRLATVAASGAVTIKPCSSRVTARPGDAVNAGSANSTGRPPGSTTAASGSIRTLAPGRTATLRFGAIGGR